jgi:PadR family transcriptional regulator PadR
MNDYESFEDVLAQVVLEEPEPTYEALLRCQKRFPDWREDLADYFALWAIQREPIDDLPNIDEDAIVEKSLQYAMKLLEEQGRIIPDDHIEQINEFDQMVLAAICVLHGRAGAGKLVDKVTEMAGRQVYLGAILRAVSRLQSKHLIECWQSDPATEALGNSNFYYNITIVGERALAYAKETSRVLATLLGDLA